MTTNKVVRSSKVPCVGADNTSNSMATLKKEQPRQRGELRKDTSIIKEGINLPRTDAASNTKLNQTAIINQKLMKTYYQMSKFYKVRKRIKMISLFEHYKDVTATPIERLTIKSFRVPSNAGLGEMESSEVPTNIGVGKMDPNHNNYVKTPNYTARMMPTNYHG